MFIKDLSLLQRDMRSVVLVDDYKQVGTNP